ncbi:hypothetical protein H6F67_09085 [Microcoleus sp. FACHB-1515]|uniref:Asr1405/Asl0597 family protein n=1 Tax=Cyanophyceae TaxID=3028117 RepID=UPI0016894E0A|nr:Asr1405/Asl0597 family protein [Microcoleus sp. FACHB-1515]MBD2090005.1 hypothetical protein [Microcoleus sp. FACHB-1515]
MDAQFNSSDTDSPASQLIAVPRCDRWQIFHRLKELEISCRCLADGRLEIATHSFTDQLQVWSVLHQLSATRSQLVRLLERSWSASA